MAERSYKFIGAVAMARRLAGILWAMWKYQRPYDSKHLASAKGIGLQKHVAQSESIGYKSQMEFELTLQVSRETP